MSSMLLSMPWSFPNPVNFWLVNWQPESRRVAGCWCGGLSNTLMTDFCMEAGQEALAR